MIPTGIIGAMNIALWILAGGALGWLGYAVVGFNEGRGLAVSIVIGAVGGFFGGKVIAPALSAAVAVPDAFNATALFFAAAVAAAFLFLGNFSHERWGL
jgi:uncharacterized membrane protein YeaQ/YmgE (transglycosylase-associated protein family)